MSLINNLTLYASLPNELRYTSVCSKKVVIIDSDEVSIDSFLSSRYLVGRSLYLIVPSAVEVVLTYSTLS